VIVRPFTGADLAAVTAIYADSMRNGTGTFEPDVPSADEMRTRLALAATHAAAGFERAKFDGWRDMVFMQKALGPGGGAPPDAQGLDCGR
jgi:L-amino acid N-acyltransferase YncA